MLHRVSIDHLVFDASFESGNACGVRRLNPSPSSSAHSPRPSRLSYEVLLQPDAWGGPAPTSYRTWFYFSVSGARAGETLDFEVPGLANQTALFCGSDHRPVVRALPSRAAQGWERIRSPCTFGPATADPSRGPYILSFSHTVLSDGDVVSFALTFPAETSAIRAATDALLQAHGNAADPLRAAPSSPAADSDIYLAREVLTHSLQGREVHLLTLTGTGGGGGGGGGKGMPKSSSSSSVAFGEPRQQALDGLFPHTVRDAETLGQLLLLEQRAMAAATAAGSKKAGPSSSGGPDAAAPPLSPGASLRPHVIRNRRAVFLSARVHPGETPGSFALDGMLELLLRPADPRAVALRSRFVFYIVPVLNPDGVARGHFRFDTRGVNLNRSYTSPSREEEPTIWAVKVRPFFWCGAQRPLWGPPFSPSPAAARPMTHTLVNNR
jgi:hypothetical protein